MTDRGKLAEVATASWHQDDVPQWSEYRRDSQGVGWPSMLCTDKEWVCYRRCVDDKRRAGASIPLASGRQDGGTRCSCADGRPLHFPELSGEK